MVQDGVSGCGCGCSDVGRDRWYILTLWGSGSGLLLNAADDERWRGKAGGEEGRKEPLWKSRLSRGLITTSTTTGSRRLDPNFMKNNRYHSQKERKEEEGGCASNDKTPEVKV